MQHGLKQWYGPLMQIYAKILALGEESTLDANIPMQLTLSYSIASLAQCQLDTFSLTTYDERLIRLQIDLSSTVEFPYAFRDVSFGISCIIFS